MGIRGSVPPMSVEDLRSRLKEDGTRTSYLYVGSEKEEGWQCARDAENMLPRLDVYRAESSEGLWFEVRPGGAAVFGFGDDIVRILDPQQAADLHEVLDANSLEPDVGDGGVA